MLPLPRAAAACLLLMLAACGRPDPAPPDAGDAARAAPGRAAETPAASPGATGEAPVKTETVTYASVGGRDVQGFLAYPAEAEGGLPGLLLFHDWWGLDEPSRALARQLAGQGYVVLAADLYGGQRAGTPELARTLMEQALANPDGVDQNLRQAHAYLVDQVKASRIGTIGWSFGGAMSLRAAVQLSGQLDATVVYYGQVPTDRAALASLQAPVLGLFAAADPGIPLASVRAFEGALKALGKRAEIVVYEGAGHGFATPAGRDYRPEAAAEAWQRVTAFLAAHLKGA